MLYHQSSRSTPWHDTSGKTSLSIQPVSVLLHIYNIFQVTDFCTWFFPTLYFPLIHSLFLSVPSPLPPRSYCTSCPSSPRKMISTSCSNISGARRVSRTKKELTPRPLSGSAHAVSGSLEFYHTLTILHKCTDYTNISVTLCFPGRSDDVIRLVWFEWMEQKEDDTLKYFWQMF